MHSDFLGSHGIEPTRDCTHFLKIGFVFAKGAFYSYCNLKCIKLDKERKNVRKKISFIHTKKHLTKIWVQYLIGFISTPTDFFN